MSYWIPFRKKENKEKTQTAMLSLETMFRLHEIAEDLMQTLPAKVPQGSSLAFFCGSEYGKDVRQMLPFSAEGVIRMKMEKEPLYSPDPAVFTSKALYISVRTTIDGQTTAGEIILKDKFSSHSCSVRGKLHPPDIYIIVRASAQGNSFGPYIFKGIQKIQRKCIVLAGKFP